MSTEAHLSLETVEHALRRVAEEPSPDRVTRLCAAAGAELENARRQRSRDWTRIVPLVRAMQGFATLQEDPFTSHGYNRPRGYPGDAELLDLIYRRTVSPMRPVTPAGLAVFRAMTTAAAPTAVRNRQTIVARLVDDAARRLGRPLRVASLGCGHLAEAEKIAALDAGGIERFWALDQDHRSLAEVHRRFPHPAVVGVRASVREFLRGYPREVRDLDVFYAAGLFDYLPDRAARRVVERMFARLRPGGTLLIANFVHGIPDRGYMEAIMDWWLLYRTESEMAALGSEIDSAEIAASRTFFEPERNIVFLELRRK